jgi:hypothetical protein
LEVKGKVARRQTKDSRVKTMDEGLILLDGRGIGGRMGDERCSGVAVPCVFGKESWLVGCGAPKDVAGKAVSRNVDECDWWELRGGLKGVLGEGAMRLIVIGSMIMGCGG